MIDERRPTEPPRRFFEDVDFLRRLGLVARKKENGEWLYWVTPTGCELVEKVKRRKDGEA